MSFGAIGVVKAAFGLAKRNFLKIIALYLAAGVLSAIAMVALGSAGLSQMQQEFGNSNAATPGAFIIAQFLFNIVMLATGLATLTLLTSDATGRDTSLKTAAITGLRKTPMAVAISILLVLLVAVVALPVFGIVAAMGSESPAIVFVVLAIFPLMLWFNASILPLMPALVAEDRGFSVIKRSFELTSGYKLPIIGAMFLLGLSAFVIFIVFGIAGSMLTGSMMHDPSQFGGAMMGALLLYFVMAVFMMVLGVAFQAAAYARLVEIK